MTGYDFDEVTSSFRKVVEVSFAAGNLDAIKETCATTRSQWEALVGTEETSLELAVNVQLATRQFARDTAKDMKDISKFGQLLDLAIDIAKAELADADLPFRMLEDVFHTQSVENCKLVWQLIEQRSEQLTDELFMPKKKNTRSKLAMLRIANYLLRRVSQSFHTVFCGKIMMFLAYAFPLSERSGVNLLGAHNVDNVTEFESEEKFEETANMRDEAAAQMDTDDATHKQDKDQAPVDYVLYSTFWSLQQCFTGKPDKAPLGCVSSAESWKSFCKSADIVLGALEAKPFSENDLIRAAARRKRLRLSSIGSEDPQADAMDTGGDAAGGQETGDFYSTKYLTDSRLLRLQLSDANLRRNVLCQFLILIQELCNSNLKLAAGLKQPDVSKRVTQIRKRTEKLLRSTPPDGTGFWHLNKHILKRERNWTVWKDKKCTPFERDLADVDDDPSKYDNPKKRRQLAQIKRTIGENCKLWGNHIGTWEMDETPTPELKTFMEPMAVALDPENCIEDDYHPKHDELYCWRGLRLFTRTQLDDMGNIPDGDFAAAVGTMITLPEKTDMDVESKATDASSQEGGGEENRDGDEEDKGGDAEDKDKASEADEQSNSGAEDASKGDGEDSKDDDSQDAKSSQAGKESDDGSQGGAISQDASSQEASSQDDGKESQDTEGQSPEGMEVDEAT